LPEGYIYPKAQRPVRDLLRKRAHLVEQQTAKATSGKDFTMLEYACKADLPGL
jgi:transposase